jgi:predicted RNA-binding Zn ribbon-like protein
VSNRIPDLPILGEPLIAEFANTLYVDGPIRLDALDHPAWITAWLQQAPCAAELGGPYRVRTNEAEQLRSLRDALRGLLTRTSHNNASDVETINAAAGPAASRRLLVFAADGELKVVNSNRATGIDRLLSTIALRIIEAIDCGQFSLNQMCSRPGCNLFYFRDHHRRRYCNTRCANADRQARYNKRLDSRSITTERHPAHPTTTRTC